MQHGRTSETTRSRKEDKELLRAIFFFAIVALFIGLLVVKGML